MPQNFSRDLGYLDKFLQGLRAHAATLDAPAAGRLAKLLDEQDRAWTEIRGLLAADPSAEPMAQETAAKPEAPTVAPAGTTVEASPRRLTVGSLIG